MVKPRLLFTADDFGVVPGIDKGVIYAAKNGLINSVACFCNSNNMPQSIKKLIEASPTIQVGAHLTISSGYALNGESMFTDKRGKFKHHSDIRRPKNKDARMQELEQLESEILNQIDTLEIELQKYDHTVKHLSVHFNSLYFVQDYFDVLARVANEYDIPIRSVHAKPGISHDFFVTQMAFQIALRNIFRQKDVDHIDEFSDQIGDYVASMETPPKMPDLLHTGHFGPIGIVPLSDKKLDKLAKRKRRKLLKAYDKLDYNTTTEFVLHIMDDNYDLLNTYKSSVDNNVYHGINIKYFDSRMAELRSLKVLKEKYGDRLFQHFTNW
ncbi:ChbG/HpnK family deacetylase [Reichenbachiella versicolor]|uniref:ChbG/HpnK family deacetylase n=1 Tax=Reichenbachiella versicolor TaxID=1821036 RepID=UPI000D6E97EC|nr:ChbG/HpnK family deacetylase [Reichenbachiella versicolor]